MRVSPVFVLVLAGGLVVGCAGEDPQVMGVVLESPSPSEADAAAATPRTGPVLGGPADAVPTVAGFASEPTDEVAAAPAARTAPSGRAGSAPATEPAAAPPAPIDRSWRLPTTEGESGTVWSVTETDDGSGGTRRVWVETSSTVRAPTGPDAPERMPLRTGLRAPGDDGTASVRQAACTAVVHPDADVDVVVDGTVVHELWVDGTVVAEERTPLTVTVRAGSGPAVASALGPVEVTLEDTGSVACQVSFVASG